MNVSLICNSSLRVLRATLCEPCGFLTKFVVGVFQVFCDQFCWAAFDVMTL